MSTTAVFVVIVIVVIIASATYVTFNGGPSSSQSSSTMTTPGIQGVVTGYVTVGPSQPACNANQPCTVNMTGYSLVFTPQCQGSSSCQPVKAALNPAGHYSVLLPAGEYTVTGLYPSCTWVGCSSAFPKTVTVEGGMQLVFDVNIDTGIR